MNLYLLALYMMIGCGAALFIHRDGEFRPIDTTGYAVACVFVWPIVFPIWMIIKPPSQLKELDFDKTHAHFQQWRKTHKTRDLFDLSYIDNCKRESDSSKEENDIIGATSPDKPYVIGKNSSFSSNGYMSDSYHEDDYIEDDFSPRKAYTPFDSKNKKNTSDIDDNKIVNSNGHKPSKGHTPGGHTPGGRTPGQEKSSTIADIIDSEHAMARKPASKAGKAFSDANVENLIENGKLRDAYRVSKRLLRVASELGEQDRSNAYLKYMSDIEIRLKKEQGKSGDGII